MELGVPDSTRSNGRPLTVSVEGNIGSGKSTFLSYCQADESLDILFEPVDKWRDVNGVNLLVCEVLMSGSLCNPSLTS